MREGETYGSWVWAAQSSIGLKYLYASRPWSPVAEAYHNRARWYSPEAGRFLTRDPIGYLGGATQYMYANGNPIGFRDPWGLDAEGRPEGDEKEKGKGILGHLNGGLKLLGKGVEEVAGKTWAAPNTIVGVGFGVAGTAAGTGMHIVGQGPMPRVTIGNNAIEFHNNPFMTHPGISIGNTINYQSGYGPSSMNWRYDEMGRVRLGWHERGHTRQSEKLGPLYGAKWLLSGGSSVNNSMERAADDYAERRAFERNLRRAGWNSRQQWEPLMIYGSVR